jgi:hypothetical protein
LTILLCFAVLAVVPTILFALASRFAPALAARLAFAPVRRSVTIALPPQAADVLTPQQDDGGTYRALPARSLALDALPGAAKADRDGHMIRFVPELSCVLVHPTWTPERLVCIHLSVGPNALLLRARRFPSFELIEVAMLLGLVARWQFLSRSPLLSATFVIMSVVGAVPAWNAASRSLDAVVAEITARVAVANGDPPLPLAPPPPPSTTTDARFTGPDEWTCACGKVNERKRSMCRRCWAQRPQG